MSEIAKPYIGIDLGGTNIQAGVIDSKARILARDSTKTRAEQGVDAVLKRIGKLAKKLMSQVNLEPDEVGGVGVGAPGTIDPKTGVVCNAVNLRWTNVPLGRLLAGTLKMPILVENDVNAGTWGEYEAGSGAGFDDMLGVFVGTGIGGGLVIGGKLYRGALKTAGEIGHVTIAPNSGLGRRTLENLASRSAIVNLLTQLIRSNHNASVLSELVGGNLTRIRSKILAEALERGDPLIAKVISDATRYIGIAIANTVTLLSLSCVVVGGGVTEAMGPTWIDCIRSAFEEHVFPPDLHRCRVVPSSLGNDAGIIGSALLARKNLAPEPVD